MRQTFAIALLSALAAGNPSKDLEFLAWASANGKQYTTVAELSERKGHWLNADAEITRLRAQNPELQFGFNPYSDNSPEEWQARTGRVDDGERRRRELQDETRGITATAQIDWRTGGNTGTSNVLVGPVKNQGSCGSCWAFAATTVQEAMDLIKFGGNYVRQSEQEAVDCA
jgi:C1A family cysteine protease